MVMVMSSSSPSSLLPPLLLLCAVSWFSRVSVVAFKYVAPEECRWGFANPEAEEVSLVCRLQSLGSDDSWSSYANFSAIPGDHTSSLRVECDEEGGRTSSIANNSFEHLVHLRELRVERCKLKSLPTYAFAGLRNLRNLTVRSYNNALNLQLGERVFAPLRQLERLDAGYNAIWTLPPRVFCLLPSLVSLNLTNNNLQDLDALGFGSADEGECQLDVVKELDLSANEFHVLPSGSFAKLPSLRQLLLQDNQISLVSDSALQNLRLLQLLDLGGNKLVALPPELLQNASELVELYLRNNSLTVLPPHLFGGLEQLLVLELHHNQLTSNWIDDDTFQDLIRLVILDMSHNRLSRIDAPAFRSLYSLQILHLEHNNIEIIADNSFSSMYNLHTLILSNNKLSHVDAFTLNGLYVLSLLSLDSNLIDKAHPDAFKNCSGLQDLALHDNALNAVPEALRVLQFLKTLDLGQNRISSLYNASFRGLQQLTGLVLMDNDVGNLTRSTFGNMPALKILNLARNKIQNVEHGTFDANVNLQAIRLDSNFLTDMNGLFANLPGLIWLNISANEITWFDYALVPLGLQWLDIHANHITSLGNYFDLEDKLRLQIMDASSNRITEINASSLADGIQLVFLNDNQISKVQPFTFLKKNNLSRVDLFGNNIQMMDLNALRLTHFAEDRALPEFYLGGNPFQCDCNMEWLQRVNSLDRQHPRVMDLDSIYCRLLYSRDRTYVPLVEAHQAQFLCPYSSHCFTLCQCCEYDACDCKMVCPYNCTCYHDQSWMANIVVCTKANYSHIPEQIPMDATEIYLDGNHIKTLSSHTFIGRKNLRVIFLNNSHIQVINNRTFNGLRALQVLHLEDNLLVELKGYEFERLEMLRELYLQNNLLTTVHNSTFVMLKSLELLRLDGNGIVRLPAWNVTLHPMLWEMSLANNNWSCDCSLMDEFKTWLTTYKDKVRDARHVRCVDNGTGAQGSSVLEFNATLCDNATATWIVQPRLFIQDYLPVVIVSVSVLVGVVLVTVMVVVFRRDISLFVFTRYGVRLFADRRLRKSDESKLFHAFVCYSSKDENFARQALAPELEWELRYHIVLLYRDFPVGSYVGDIMEEAAECCCRTIILVTDNFIKNDWCRFEYKSAYQEMLVERRPIAILVGDVLSRRDLDPTIRDFLKGCTCLEWGGKLFWEKFKYNMPERMAERKR